MLEDPGDYQWKAQEEMEPQFSLNQKFYLTADHFSDGHCLITRRMCASPKAPGPLRQLLGLMPGTYDHGVNGGPTTNAPLSNFDHLLIFDREEYRPIIEKPVGVKFINSDEIHSYQFNVLEGEKFTLLIAPKYIPVLRLGFAYAKSPYEAVMILEGPTLDATLIALIMPMKYDSPR